MIKALLYRDTFAVPIICGVLIQLLKVILYSIVEKRIAIERFVQPHGMPNLHSAVFGSLFTVVGIKYGVSSILFSFVATYSVIIVHDTMRFKREKGKQVRLLNMLLSSIDSRNDLEGGKALRVVRFRPFDVLSGMVIGILGTILIL
ncbi:MAG: divergent PAP2 family protein [Candidatus Krumholzibacteria bacterium]|nr:divergent PAP2 family protein [Candidatus Krumholzibacteria bacterium]